MVTDKRSKTLKDIISEKIGYFNLRSFSNIDRLFNCHEDIKSGEVNLILSDWSEKENMHLDIITGKLPKIAFTSERVLKECEIWEEWNRYIKFVEFHDILKIKNFKSYIKSEIGFKYPELEKSKARLLKNCIRKKIEDVIQKKLKSHLSIEDKKIAVVITMILLDPKILILKNYLFGLTKKGIEIILSLLEDFARNNDSIVIVTAYYTNLHLDLINYNINTIILFYKSRLIFTGPKNKFEKFITSNIQIVKNINRDRHYSIYYCNDEIPSYNKICIKEKSKCKINNDLTFFNIKFGIFVIFVLIYLTRNRFYKILKIIGGRIRFIIYKYFNK